MPVFTIDAPLGAQETAKLKMLKKSPMRCTRPGPSPTHAVGFAHQTNAVSQDGSVGTEPVRPVCTLEAPELNNLDAKRKLTRKIESAIAAAYGGIANVEEVLVLINHYPLEDVGWRGKSLQSGQARNRRRHRATQPIAYCRTGGGAPVSSPRPLLLSSGR